MDGSQWIVPLNGDARALLARTAPLAGLKVVLAPDGAEGWVDGEALCAPEASPMADRVVGDLVSAGFGANRKAAAASLMLRHGWAAGPIIAAYLAEGRVVRVQDYALRFTRSTFLERIWIRQAEVAHHAASADRRADLLASLTAFSEPVLESLQHWSGYSRHALLSMLASSWMVQFAHAGEMMDCREEAVREGRIVLGRHRELARALPETYVIANGERSEVCQILKACCLQHKGHRRRFCPTCPVIRDRDRIVLNREWVCRER
ncbi:hypothetical protein F8A86_06790 [Betaproteobacteria bacterium SCN1]|jgi:hypothetical protein|nr:hypothetical protein F8A86_06790 [Betaproteobacteria bacterium SCN1]